MNTCLFKNIGACIIALLCISNVMQLSYYLKITTQLINFKITDARAGVQHLQISCTAVCICHTPCTWALPR